MTKSETYDVAIEVGFDPAYARKSDLLRMFAKEIEKRTMEKCKQALRARFMGDLNREDMEVKRCIQALEEIK